MNAMSQTWSGLGPLQPLLELEDVSDIMVNGAGPVWIERGGVLSVTDVVVDTATAEHLVERLVGPQGKRADRTSPLADARLDDGSRVHVVVPPLAVDGPYITIRRFRRRPVPLEELATTDVVSLLRAAVRGRANIVVTGGTSSGKTTVLNALAGSIDAGERLVTIEDAAELRLEADHVVRLEARPPSTDGPAAVSVRDLVRAALRMRPDRIIVGEVRGPEALDMLQAMNTGHEGSLSTCHANSPLDALRRLEVMVATGGARLPLPAIRRLVGAAVDLIVHLQRGSTGDRRIVAVAEPELDGRQVRTLADTHGLLAGGRRPLRRPGHDRCGPQC